MKIRSVIAAVLLLLACGATTELIAARPLTTPAFRVIRGQRIPGTLVISEDRIEFLRKGKQTKVLHRDEIVRVESNFRKEGASASSVFLFGLYARKRNLTMIGIEMADGQIVVFSIKGKGGLEYVMVIERMAREANLKKGATP